VAANRETKKVAVLVSGDPGLKSLAARVIDRFGREGCRVIPGISSVQTAFARLGLEWYDARIISAHEGVPRIAPASLTEEAKIAILAGGGESMAWIVEAARVLAKDHSVYLCQDLTLATERVEQVGQEDLKKGAISSRSIVLFIKEDGIE
jgi:precorrin-6y C5,15-methyltransferase (decarboxylating) CbiE subunit